MTITSSLARRHISLCTFHDRHTSETVAEVPVSRVQPSCDHGPETVLFKLNAFRYKSTPCSLSSRPFIRVEVHQPPLRLYVVHDVLTNQRTGSHLVCPQKTGFGHFTTMETAFRFPPITSSTILFLWSQSKVQEHTHLSFSGHNSLS